MGTGQMTACMIGVLMGVAIGAMLAPLAALIGITLVLWLASRMV